MAMHARARLRAGLLIGTLIAVDAGCGDDPAPLPHVDLYAAAWQQVVPPEVNGIGLAPKELRWHDGVLYFHTWDVPPAIVALPVSPGVAPVPRVVSNEDASRLWVEGDRVLYSQSEVLRAVPISGGTPVTVLSGPDTVGISSAELLEVPNQDLDADYYYYDTWRSGAGAETWNAWRLPRAGGDPQKLGELTTLPADSLDRFEHGPLGILTSAFWGRAWFAPYDGSGVRELAYPDGAVLQRVGTDGTNVLWSRLGPGTTANHEMFEVWRGTPDSATPTLLWAPAPNIAPETAVPDGAGGWLFSAIEYFSDELIHTSIWHLDAAGNATRTAANPSAGEELISSMVLAPDAIYAGLSVFDSPARWTILRFPAVDAASASAELSAQLSAPPPPTAAPFALSAALARRRLLSPTH
jgi:hypothetical protein